MSLNLIIWDLYKLRLIQQTVQEPSKCVFFLLVLWFWDLPIHAIFVQVSPSSGGNRSRQNCCRESLVAQKRSNQRFRRRFDPLRRAKQWWTSENNISLKINF